VVASEGCALYVDTLKNHRPGRCRWWPTWCRSSTGGAGEEAGGLAVRCAKRRPAAGAELETVGRLAERQGGSRSARHWSASCAGPPAWPSALTAREGSHCA